MLGMCMTVERLAAMISTDPPYYDNIGYADLSDFFYVWLRVVLEASYPSAFRDDLDSESTELIASPFRHEGRRRKLKHSSKTALLKRFANSANKYCRRARHSLLRIQTVRTDDDGSGDSRARRRHSFNRLGDYASGLVRSGSDYFAELGQSGLSKTEMLVVMRMLSRLPSSSSAALVPTTPRSPPAKSSSRRSAASCPTPCGICSGGALRRWTWRRRRSGRGWPSSPAMPRSWRATARR